VSLVDAFDLPDWVGEQPVTWAAVTSLTGGHLVSGELRAGPGKRHECDVLACDVAYPLPVLSEAWRHDAHQAWVLGQVLLLSYDDRLTLVLPGVEVTAEPVLEAVRRLAKSVGAPAARFSVALQL
jgi:hypothetical protein